MVCRLNRPVRGRLVYFPWSIMGGHAAKMVAGDISGLEAVPQLLSAHQDGSITSFQGLFESMRAVGRDADGTIPIFDLETRDFPTGTGQPNHVRGIRLHYTLDALPGEPIPGIDTSISSGDPVSQTYAQLLTTGTYQDVLNTYANYDNAHRGLGWPTSLPPGEWTDDDERYWPILTPPAPPSDGRNPAKWPLPRTIRTRWVRGRFVCDDPVARLIVHKDEFGVRPATHYR